MDRNFKFIFFGTPKFASIVLEELIASDYVPIAVICNPDRPVGRKKTVTPPPVKILAKKHGIQILQPETLTDYQLSAASYKPNLAIVASYSKILPKEIMESFPLGAIGVHPSLLPKYRGASPIQTVILNGETETGVTLFLMDEKVDRGPVITQEKIKIDADEAYPELHDRLATLGGKLLVKILPDFLKEKLKPQEQNHAEATMTKKFKTEDGFVAPELLKQAQEGGGEIAREIFNKIRALGAEPGVWTITKEKRMRIRAAHLESDGRLKITVIQAEGKKPGGLDKNKVLS